MNILGISGLYHDSAAALCRNGDIAAAAQEERFTRRKHDPGLPVHAAQFCLERAGLTMADVDAVVYYDNPLLTADRFLGNLLLARGDDDNLLDVALPSLCGNKLWVHELIKQHLGSLGTGEKLLVTEHHAAHAASAFYPSPFERAAIITMDGVGEWATTTIGVGNGKRVELLQSINYPDSLGLLYSAFTYFCGFKVNSGEYKLMGLAPYGTPKYFSTIMDTLVCVKQDGSYRLNMEYFDFHTGRAMTNDSFSSLFGGPPRKAEQAITQREIDLAASIQKVTEEILLRIAEHTRKTTGEKNVVMAGGVALNCMANSALMNKKIFEAIWVQPASGDAGGAVGAALYAYHMHFGHERIVKKHGSYNTYLGPSFSHEAIKKFLADTACVFSEEEDDDALYARVAQALTDGNVVGFFSGNMEFGPRALGARSILADARKPEMQAKLNLKIKFRESFRPFAPAVLAERAKEYFVLENDSPYMLFTADVVEHKRKYPTRLAPDAQCDLMQKVNQDRSDIPAVTHVDYSARVQTVTEEHCPRFHALLGAFDRLTGCPVLVNTSFNVRGEPIVCSPEDAVRCFVHTEMDMLILENYILVKADQPEGLAKSFARREYEPD